VMNRREMSRRRWSHTAARSVSAVPQCPFEAGRAAPRGQANPVPYPASSGRTGNFRWPLPVLRQETGFDRNPPIRPVASAARDAVEATKAPFLVSNDPSVEDSFGSANRDDRVRARVFDNGTDAVHRHFRGTFTRPRPVGLLGPHAHRVGGVPPRAGSGASAAMTERA